MTQRDDLLLLLCFVAHRRHKAHVHTLSALIDRLACTGQDPAAEAVLYRDVLREMQRAADETAVRVLAVIEALGIGEEQEENEHE
jgi:hypothetical protein